MWDVWGVGHSRPNEDRRQGMIVYVLPYVLRSKYLTYLEPMGTVDDDPECAVPKSM